MTCGQKAKMRAAGIARIISAFLLSTLTGCLQVDQTLVLEKDGSGTLDLSYAMSEETLQQWQGVARQMLGSSGPDDGSPVMPFDFSDQEIRADFKEYEGDGVILRSVQSETRDGWKTRRLRIGFRSLAGVARTGFLADRNISLVKDANGNYVFTQQPGGDGNLPPELSALAEPGAEALFSDMMKGFKAAVRVKTPGRILETNAPEKEDRQAAWTFDLDRDPQALQKVQVASLRIVFEGKGLDIPAFHSAAVKR